MIAPPEGHRVEREPADRHLAAKVVGVGSHLPDVVDTHVADEQVRSRILGTARLEQRELERELARQDLGRDLRVHPDGGHGSLSAKALAHDHVELFDEVGDPIDRDGESRRHRVTAVLDQDVVALVERFGDVDAGDRAARALAFVPVDGDHDRGPAVILHEPRRAEADDAGGPLGVRDDRDPRVRSPLRALARTRDHLPGQLLPLGVALLEALGESLRLVGVLGQQEPKRILGVVDPAGRVQTRAEHEADVARANTPELQTRALDEGSHAEERRAVQGLESEFCEHAVTAAKWDDVGDRRQRAQLQELVLPQGVREIAEKTLGEHQGHAGAGELLFDRGIAGTPRVHERVRVRKLRRWVMVVGHDEIDAEVARERRLLHRGDAAIDAHDDLGAILGQLPERRGVQAVALFVPIRDVRPDHYAELPERADEDGRPAYAVDVVVSIDDDALASRERTTEPLDRAIQIEHRRTLFGRLCGEKRGHVARGEAAAGEDLSDERGDTIRHIPGLFGHDPAPLRREGHLTFKYLAQVFTLALAAASCTPAAPSTTPTALPAAATAGRGLAASIAVKVSMPRHWFTVPDPLANEPALINVEFASDPSAGEPRVRLAPINREAPLVAATPTRWSAQVDLTGLAPGSYKVGVIERVAGADVVIDGNEAGGEVRLSEPEYVVWTLDFEGDASSDAALANTAAIADEHKIPMTIMWNPRVWTTTQVAATRGEAMLAWTKERVAKGDELSLHLHMWTDFVRAAGVVPRTAPSWAGRGDGYDVPITAYPESDQRVLIEYSLRLMSEHGLARPTTFRAGGQFANEATLRTLAALGFVADASAVPAGSSGRLPYPWTLGADAQPYRPSATDANKAGDLQLLEAPTIGGNTFGFDVRTIDPIIRADLSYLAPARAIATTRRALTIVSHPGTIDTTERAAITALFDAFTPLRYDLDKGPVRFVTLAELARAYSF